MNKLPVFHTNSVTVTISVTVVWIGSVVIVLFTQPSILSHLKI